jgi:hypothetical protein
VTHSPNGHIFLQWLADANQPYVIQASPDLVSTFIGVAQVTSDSNGSVPYEDSNPSNLPKRFYNLAESTPTPPPPVERPVRNPR